MTPATTLTDAIAIATHETRIKTLEEWAKDMAKKIDRIQWLLVATLAAAIVNLLKH